MALFNLKTLTPVLSPAAIALFVIVILAMTNNATAQTYFTYDFNGKLPPDLTLQGDAHFPSDSPYLRLTKTDAAGTPLEHSVGRVLYSEQVLFWEPGVQVDLETTIKFIIKPKANDNNPADGIAFFIAPVGTTIPPGSDGGSLGIFDSSGNSSSVFAVEFDIYINGEWDPNFRHVGIDIGSRKSVSKTEIPGPVSGDVVELRVNYEEATRVIRAVATVNSNRYEVTYEKDLSSFLPQQVQVGIAASTGDYVAIHDVVSWYFSATPVHQIATISQVV